MYEVLAHLFVMLFLPGDSKGAFSVLSRAANCYYQSNRSKKEAIPLSALPKEPTSEFSGLSSLYPFNSERQEGKLRIPTFKVFCSNSTK